MNSTRTIITKVVFSAAIALSLLASGMSADARTTGELGQRATNGGGTSASPTAPADSGDFQALGITWE